MSLLTDHIEDSLRDLDDDDIDDVLTAVRRRFGVEVVALPKHEQYAYDTYTDPQDRFVVSLIASYDPDRDAVTSDVEAVAAALRLTRDEGSRGTQWWVYDRQTGTGRIVEQGDVERDEDFPALA